jgi:drug/metabolite transporter (DMT)-like permease
VDSASKEVVKDMKSITQTGVYLALATAVISGISIYLNKFAVNAVDDALLFTTLKNSLVGTALTGYLVLTLLRAQAVRLSWKQWLGLGGLAVIGGSLPFLLFFEGLAPALL